MSSYFDYGQTILFGETLEDKLVDFTFDWTDWKDVHLPQLPGRKGRLAFSENQAKFPKTSRLNEADKKYLQRMIEQHASLTESKVAGFIMSDFDNQLAHFVKVFPRDYKAVLLQKEKNNQQAI